ncbi:MAG: hypothetical protein P8Y69_01875, partial [Gammaproteobacteria bacterium]
FTGPDVTAFLQGYFTCDLHRLSDGEYHLTALTNLQGRVVASGWCVEPESSRVEWVVHASVAERVAAFMARYLAFSKTTLVRRSDDHVVVGLTGQPPAPMIVDEVAVLQDLIAAHETVAERQWQLACIEARVALVAAPTSERFLPQMLGLVEADAVDFDKGCYLGQEVVARAQHRGEVKRRLHRFRSEADATADAVLSPGDVLSDEVDRESGVVITATARGPRAEPLECLAVVREPPADRYVAGGVTLVRVTD